MPEYVSVESGNNYCQFHKEMALYIVQVILNNKFIFLKVNK